MQISMKLFNWIFVCLHLSAHEIYEKKFTIIKHLTMNNLNGNITSPDFPLFSSKKSGSWKFYFPPGRFVTYLDFNDLAMDDCSKQYVMIDTQKYCTTTKPICIVYARKIVRNACETNLIENTLSMCDVIYTDAPSLDIYFNSKGSNNARFSLMYNLHPTNCTSSPHAAFGKVGPTSNHSIFSHDFFNWTNSLQGNSGLSLATPTVRLTTASKSTATTPTSQPLTIFRKFNTMVGETIQTTQSGPGETDQTTRDDPQDNLNTMIIVISITVIIALIALAAIFLFCGLRKLKFKKFGPPPTPPTLVTDTNGYMTPVISGHTYERPLPLTPSQINLSNQSSVRNEVVVNAIYEQEPC